MLIYVDTMAKIMVKKPTFGHQFFFAIPRAPIRDPSTSHLTSPSSMVNQHIPMVNIQKTIEHGP